MKINGLPISVFIKHRTYIYFYPLIAFARFVTCFFENMNKNTIAYREKLLKEHDAKMTKINN